MRFVEELSYELMATGGCPVQTVSSILTPDIQDIACFAKKLGVQLVFEGTVLSFEPAQIYGSIQIELA